MLISGLKGLSYEKQGREQGSGDACDSRRYLRLKIK